MEPLIKKVYSRKYSKTLDVVFGDFHNGHLTGIASEKYYTERMQLNDAQLWLLGVYNQRLIPDIKNIIKDVKPDFVHGEMGGDMGDMDVKNRSDQYWSKKSTEIEKNAIELLTPLIKLFDAFHALKGTKSHTNGELDKAIASNFDNCVGIGNEVRYELEGVLCEARHKGANRSKWVDENLLNALRSKIILSRAANKERIPDVSFRHHYHWYGTSPKDKPFRVISIPSFQLPYDHDFIAEIDAVGETAHVGAFCILYQNGKVVDDWRLLYKYPKEIPWTPK